MLNMLFLPEMATINRIGNKFVYLVEQMLEGGRQRDPARGNLRG